ncbi:MAG TPA: PAS domain S-box protein, partial [Desulfobacteria bacterium]|nr:PAS domain S-box protein [Desulfobacteria bacterium]
VHVIANPVFDREGKPEYYNAIMIDVTAQKQAEQALRESEEKYRNLVEESFDGIFIQKGQRIIFANKRLNEMLGYEDGELIGRKHWVVYHSDSQKLTRERAQIRLLGEAVERRYEVKLQRKDGSWFFGEINARLITFPSNQERGIQVWIKDIDKRKRDEKKLKDSKRFLQTLIDAIPAPVFYKDREGKYLGFNSAFETFFGAPDEEMVGKTVFGVNPPELAELYYAKDQELFESGGVQRYESQWQDVHGKLRDFIFNKAAFCDGKGTVIGLIGVLIDITERKQGEEKRRRLETQLQQAQKMESIGTLAGGIAHDFNNILSVIIGYAELALDDVDKDSLIENRLQEIYSAGNRAKELVKQILAFARQSEEKVKPIQVDTIVKEVLKFIRSSIPTTIEIEQNIVSKSLIMGNSTQVHQILMNLCTNAAQSMENDGGILKVSLTDVTFEGATNRKDLNLKSGDYLKIEISDTGTGIAPDIVGSIFEPYFTTKAPGEGTGMGLAMVHGIVETYGGKITLDSTRGKGTTFAVYLPISGKRQADRPYKTDESPMGTERILFVDDEATIAGMGSQVLERLGYFVTMRTSSLEALELFRSKSEEFDLVITDMTMPNMTGDQLAMELMAIQPNIPVILCTGYSKKISDESASEIGIKAIAYKPIVKAELAKTVRKVLDEVKMSD